ncbi:phosphoglycerate mutase family protein [Paenarthrobacter sp. DKR-5]|uniref:histidine phosphatase family protein n=1 Tax=Paenarthrobacter sp. DKR-5 TaxID=2835535 RepID=UPI001BDD5598|nr:histidine phosphatase family protein [Paenarthrobacter sp. DKR-5]MBT1001190.1 phosphoglycerate mutase family protein [Paenarthrobacter sp. DKR-5]
MRLILIRHGQTPSNVAQLLDTGVPGPELTELGRRQAAALPELLGNEGIGALFASNQLRAQLTAAPLADALGLDVLVRAGLREIAAGHLELRSDEEAVRSYMSTVHAWTSGELERAMPGGPAGHETFSRFDAVVAEALGSGHDTVAMVSHGAMIRAWTAARAVNLGPDFLVRSQLGNTGVVVLDATDRRYEVLTWMGEPVVSPELAGSGADGPAGDPF